MAAWNEVLISDIKSKARFDADFFQNKYIELDKFVECGLPISKISDTVDLQSNGAFKQIFNILSEPGVKEIPYIRSGNVGDFFLNKEELQFITKNAHDKLYKTHTIVGDVLMARKGKIGGATLITEEDTNFNSNDNVVNIRIKDDQILPEYFVTFWNSKFGLMQIERFATGNVQPWLSMKQVRMLKTVILDLSIQQEISKIIQKAHIYKKHSKSLYREGQKILEKELCLDQLVMENSNKYETSFSEVVMSNRLDAQCYIPDYIVYEKYLRRRGNFDYLRNVVSTLAKGRQANTVQDGDLEYVSIKDIKGIEIYSHEYCRQSLKHKIAQKDDLLLAITGATIGKIGIVSRSNNLAFSGDLLSIKTNERINPYYLLAVMSHPIGQSQCQRWITGSTNGHLAPKDVNKFVIPRLSDDSEKRVSELLKASITSTQESEILLEQAIKRVEELIEGVILQ